MSTPIRRLLPVAAAALIAPVFAGAQSVYDSEVRLAPQYVQYKINAPSNETISELAVPVFVTIPFGSRFTFDVGTSYARARAITGSATSEINGLTDTQLRGNLTLGTDFVIITGGVNVPTGQSAVTLDQLTAAGRIGNDFLAFPISNMGTGLALTGGIAVARPMGEWNIGFGGAVRHSSSYDPFAVPGQTLRFQPGDEYRARIGVDRPAGAGRLSLGVSYSAFGDDQAGTSVYNTGNRVIAQTVFTNSYMGTDVSFAAYNMFRAPGNYASGDPAGRENIANGYLGLGIHALGTVFEPSVEGRHWYQLVPANPQRGEHGQASMLATFGLRTRLGVGALTLYPGGGYTFGQLAAMTAVTNQPTHATLSGWRVQLAARLAP